MKLKEVVIQSKYLQKANCMIRALTQAGVSHVDDLDNLPRALPKVCGEDVYQVVTELRKIWLAPPPLHE